MLVVQRLLQSSVDPLAGMKVLCVFHDDPRQPWTIDEMTNRLDISPLAISRAFVDLQQHALIVGIGDDGAFRLGALGLQTNVFVGALGLALREDSGAVSRAIGVRSCSALRDVVGSFTRFT